LDLLVLALIFVSLIFAWQAEASWVWILLGLALIAGSLIICWWANFSMQSRDREAPFVVGAAGFCTCLPASLFCFGMASHVGGAKSKVPEVGEREGLEGTIGSARFFSEMPEEAKESEPVGERRGLGRFFRFWNRL
jgi:hypothetical protein